jgi:glycosyltransferase involved in cell wall biosynthesis
VIFSHLKAKRKDILYTKGFSKHKRIYRSKSNRILFVGMAESSHFERWVSVTVDNFPEAQVYIFPSDSPHLKKSGIKSLKVKSNSVKIFQLIPFARINYLAYFFLDYFFGMTWRAFILRYFMLLIRPKIVHFHEMQHAAYIYNYIYDYKRTHSDAKYIISTWGSDLNLYSYLSGNKHQVETCLKWVDVVTAERSIEQIVLQEYEFNKQFVAPMYITVGRDIADTQNLSRTSERKSIIVKGYQDTSGRALNVIQVLSEISESLVDFEILVFSASDSVKAHVDYLNNSNGMKIRVLNRMPNSDLQKYFRNSRIYIGMSISDGLSTSMVEAMSAGTFPIQSANSAAPKFLVDGQSGFVVDPWDLPTLKESILKALEDDLLVDAAAELNLETLKRKFSLEIGIEKMRSLYIDLS